MKTTLRLMLVMLLSVGVASFAQEHAPAVNHNTWTSGTAMPTARMGTYVGVIGKNVYVIGGATDSAVVGNNEIYNTKTKTWTTGAPMPTPMWAGASAVVNGILYCIGGSVGGSDTQNIVEAYDLATDSWSTKSPMPTSRNSVTAVADKGVIYVIGGFAFGTGRLATVESYNPATDTWTEEAPLLVGKSWPAVGLSGTTIVAAGGLTNSGVTGDNEGYNAKKNLWSKLTADPTPRQRWMLLGYQRQLVLCGRYRQQRPALNERSLQPESKFMDDSGFSSAGSCWSGLCHAGWKALLLRGLRQRQLVPGHSLRLRADLPALDFGVVTCFFPQGRFLS